MKSAWTILLVAVIIGCGVWMTYYYKTQPVAGEPVLHKAPLCCTVCSKSWVGDISREPVDCKFCKGIKTAWGAMQCRNPKCGAIFAWVHDKPTDLPECPKCKGKAAGQPPPSALSEH
ncbi:MAG: hypothetical protein HY269_10720 [Deltaproteobacteria bacterium]|nr:hypothetical protein [Deltaproteobacteria bacterium]